MSGVAREVGGGWGSSTLAVRYLTNRDDSNYLFQRKVRKILPFILSLPAGNRLHVSIAETCSLFLFGARNKQPLQRRHDICPCDFHAGP
eukprot:365057-Chlamydomonas_euryale.AAC.17